MPHSSHCFTGEQALPVTTALLGNGLRVFVLEKHHAPLVSAQAWVKTGSIHEGKYLGYGLSHFLEHMMFQGSERFSGHSVADTVNSCGGDINAYTSYGNTVYHIDLPSRHTATAIDILADMISAPSFPQEKFAAEKSVILRERDMNRDNPGRVLTEKLWQETFQCHPTRHPIIGYSPMIKSVNRDIMTHYYSRRYSPSRAFFVVVGDVDAAKVIEQLESVLGKWQGGALDDPPLCEEPKQICPRHAEYTFPDPLARLAISFKVPDASHPDIPALDLLASIMGQNRSSRLVSSLKMEKQLAMNISTFCYTPYFSGISAVSAICTPDKLDNLEQGIISEIDSVLENGVLQCELDRSVLQNKTDYYRSMLSSSTLGRIIGNTVLTYGSPDYIDKYLQDISKVTAEDVQNAARKYLLPEMSTTIKILPEDFKKQVNKKGSSGKIAEDNLPSLTHLDNGLRLVSIQDSRSPLVDISIIFPGGTFFETEVNAGTTHLLSLMLMGGSAKYNEQEFMELLDDNALNLSISSGSNTLCIRMNCHCDALDIAFEALREITLSASFDPNIFRREHHNTKELVKSRRLNPQSAAEEKMYQLLFASHPYSRSLYGTDDSIASMDVQRVKEFYSTICMDPSKIVAGIAGDITCNDAKTRFGELFSKALWTRSPSSVDLQTPKFTDGHIKQTVTVPREQAFIVSALPGCDNIDDERFALDIVQQALNGQASQLFKSIREDAGLAYYTGLYAQRGIHKGFLGFYAGTHPKHAEEVTHLIDKERLRLAEQGLSKSEFDAAKACMCFNIAEQTENLGSVLFSSLLAEYYGNGYMMPWTRQSRYEALTLKKLNAVVKKYMTSNTVVTVTAQP